MRTLRILLLILFTVSAMLSCGGSPGNSPAIRSNNTNPDATQSEPENASINLQQLDFSSIDPMLEEAAPQLGGGIAFILVTGRQVVYRKAFGNYKIDSVLPIASSSKWLSGAVVMSLVDEGKLSLDDPVSKFLPGFSGDKAAITMRQLFSHTSGLPPEAPCRNNKRTSLEKCANEVATMRLRSQPGTRFFYGGVSIHVGGRVVEVVTGKPWNEVFKEKIAVPLGLEKTDYFAYGETQNPRPAGDGRSTLDEFARFLMMILNGGSFEGKRVLSTSAVAEMHRDQTRGSSIEYTIFGDKGYLDPRLPKATYGVGTWREVYDESGGVLEASSPGALGSYPWIDFKRGVGGMVLTRSSFSRSLPVYLRVKKRIQEIIDAK